MRHLLTHRVAMCRSVARGLSATAMVAACSTGDATAPGSEAPTATLPPTAPVITAELGLKEVTLAWATVSGASTYRVWESDDTTSEFVRVGSDLTVTDAVRPFAVHLQGGARYRVEACNAGGCAASAVVPAAPAGAGDLLKAVGYFKPWTEEP